MNNVHLSSTEQTLMVIIGKFINKPGQTISYYRNIVRNWNRQGLSEADLKEAAAGLVEKGYIEHLGDGVFRLS